MAQFVENSSDLLPLVPDKTILHDERAFTGETVSPSAENRQFYIGGTWPTITESDEQRWVDPVGPRLKPSVPKARHSGLTYLIGVTVTFLAVIAAAFAWKQRSRRKVTVNK